MIEGILQFVESFLLVGLFLWTGYKLEKRQSDK